MSIMDKVRQLRELADELEAHFKRQRHDVWGETATVQIPHTEPEKALPPPEPAHPVSGPVSLQLSPDASAVENVKRIVAAGVAKPGKRASDGRLCLSQYGGPSDRTPDPNTQKGEGNRGNKLTPMSVALSRDLITKLSPRGGDDVVLEVEGRMWPIGHYDDSTGPEAVNCIDVYDPKDELGQDTFMAIVPQGTWTLHVGTVSYTGALTPIKPVTQSLTRAVAMARAHSLAGGPFTYELSAEPHLLTWERLTGKSGDCSGFVDACFGIDRNETGANTDAMWADAAPDGAHKFYIDVTGPAQVGDVYVRKSGDGHTYGHTGVISEVTMGIPTKVIHCSSMNPPGLAIQETDCAWFTKNGAKVVRAVALID